MMFWVAVSLILTWLVKFKDDKNVAHLTHVTEMEKKTETLARITTILKDVIQNKVLCCFIFVIIVFFAILRSNGVCFMLKLLLFLLENLHVQSSIRVYICRT